jgi:hypothetical protein
MTHSFTTRILRHSTSTLLLAGLATLATSAQAAPDLTKLPPASTRQGVTYAADIRPLFETSCVRCHGPERPKGGLRLDSLEGVLKGSKDGKVIVPGSSEKSHLVIAVARLDDKSAMPPKPRAGQRRGGPGAPGGAPASGAGTTPNAAAQPGAPKEGAAPGGPGGPRAPMGPPAKPLTAEEVGLVRAWVDQGAK